MAPKFYHRGYHPQISRNFKTKRPTFNLKGILEETPIKQSNDQITTSLAVETKYALQQTRSEGGNGWIVHSEEEAFYSFFGYNREVKILKLCCE